MVKLSLFNFNFPADNGKSDIEEKETLGRGEIFESFNRISEEIIRNYPSESELNSDRVVGSLGFL